ncbi:MAG: putative rane-associated protein [Phycisphaerales bacterium]|nr:putative rane-associated protein [Phycisphaerales bacterium]
MELINKLIWTLFHLKPETLTSFMNYVGPQKLYVVLFAILFAETGLVVTPFLPGDSLLFAVGVICALPDGPLNVPLVLGVIFAAVLLGDNTNYWIGRRLGKAVFTRESSRLLNKKHLVRAQSFYEAYGAKTIILARFVPIVRTFAPFVAGIGRMHYARFLAFSVLGAVLWIAICVTAGYTLANVRFIREHFDLVVVAIVIISVLPMVFEYMKHRKQVRAKAEVVAAE